MNPVDIWRAATLLIDRHGDQAAAAAARRIGDLQQDNDEEGAEIWARIHRAIIDLQAPPPPGTKPN